MAPTEDEKYQPKDAVSHGVKGATITGSIGLLMAAVKNSLEKANVGPWTTFTRHGHIIFTFAAVGGTFAFTRAAVANLREKDDHWDDATAGLVAGSIMGLRRGRFASVLGWSLFTGSSIGTFAYTGNTLRGYFTRQGEEEWERKERLRLTRRRPIEETLANIGEGRGIRPPGYEERRRQRLKEKYGIDVHTVSADPDAE
ncbi:hypothetical protein VTJ04DRAFT_7063 [Mycothermus thermophilus]|uniref:uncharacterized protein n=1 Tax=Humicola insolens TaxID=85995 RepID=UPI003743115C